MLHARAPPEMLWLSRRCPDIVRWIRFPEGCLFCPRPVFSNGHLPESKRIIGVIGVLAYGDEGSKDVTKGQAASKEC